MRVWLVGEFFLVLARMELDLMMISLQQNHGLDQPAQQYLATAYPYPTVTFSYLTDIMTTIRKIMNQSVVFTHWKTRYVSGWRVPRPKRMVSVRVRMRQAALIIVCRRPTQGMVVSWRVEDVGGGIWDVRERRIGGGTLQAPSLRPRSARQGVCT